VSGIWNRTFITVIDTETGEWQNITGLTSANYSVMFAVGSKLYVSGTGERTFITVIDTETGEWQNITGLTSTHYSVMFAVGSKLYVSGIWNRTFITVIDTETGEWQNIRGLTSANYSIMFAVGSKLYVSGTGNRTFITVIDTETGDAVVEIRNEVHNKRFVRFRTNATINQTHNFPTIHYRGNTHMLRLRTPFPAGTVLTMHTYTDYPIKSEMSTIGTQQQPCSFEIFLNRTLGISGVSLNGVLGGDVSLQLDIFSKDANTNRNEIDNITVNQTIVQDERGVVGMVVSKDEESVTIRTIRILNEGI
jgi:glutathione peroxidase-family protein